MKWVLTGREAVGFSNTSALFWLARLPGFLRCHTGPLSVGMCFVLVHGYPEFSFVIFFLCSLWANTVGRIKCVHTQPNAHSQSIHLLPPPPSANLPGAHSVPGLTLHAKRNRKNCTHMASPPGSWVSGTHCFVSSYCSFPCINTDLGLSCCSQLQGPGLRWMVLKGQGEDHMDFQDRRNQAKLKRHSKSSWRETRGWNLQLHSTKWKSSQKVSMSHQELCLQGLERRVTG